MTEPSDVSVAGTPVAPFVPLDAEEQHRLRSLLDSVSTHTLLLSLLELKRGSQDAELIIAALLDRLPAYGGVREPAPEPGARRP